MPPKKNDRYWNIAERHFSFFSYSPGLMKAHSWYRTSGEVKTAPMMNANCTYTNKGSVSLNALRVSSFASSVCCR